MTVLAFVNVVTVTGVFVTLLTSCFPFLKIWHLVTGIARAYPQRKRPEPGLLEHQPIARGCAGFSLVPLRPPALSCAWPKRALSKCMLCELCMECSMGLVPVSWLVRGPGATPCCGGCSWHLPAGQVVAPTPCAPDLDMSLPSKLLIQEVIRMKTLKKIITPRKSIKCVSLKESKCIIEIALYCEFLGRHFREEVCCLGFVVEFIQLP